MYTKRDQHVRMYTHTHKYSENATQSMLPCLNALNSYIYTHNARQTYSPSSQSNWSMAEKSAPPTPTMMMDMGSREALTMALMVSGMSEMTPSVSINRMKYCCRIYVHSIMHTNKK